MEKKQQMKVDVSILSQIDFHLLNLSESILILHLTREGRPPG